LGEALEKLEAFNQKKEPLLLDTENPIQRKNKRDNGWKFWERSQYTLFMFLLMCSEWGDESQLVTIGLSTQYSPLAIILGGGLAQALCVLVAMMIGKCLQGVVS
jgi:putative Ca2+/H+ antiporter (TMEM165/GDT1 family)